MKGLDDICLNYISKTKQIFFKPKTFPVSYKIIYPKNKTQKAIFFFHGWGTNSKKFIYLAEKFRQDYAIVLFDYPKETVSDDTKKTIDYFNNVLSEAISAKNKLERIGVKDINFFGVSLGGYIAIYLANKIEVQKVYLCVTGDRLSETFWTGISGRDIKNSLIKKNYNLKRLIEEWKSLEPCNNLENLEKTKIFMRLSENDKLVLFRLQENLMKKIAEKDISLETTNEKYFGHYITIVNTLLDYRTAKRFFEND